MMDDRRYFSQKTWLLGARREAMLRMSQRRLRWQRLHRRRQEEFITWRSKNLSLSWNGQRRSRIEWAGKGASSFCRGSEFQRICRRRAISRSIGLRARIESVANWDTRRL